MPRRPSAACATQLNARSVRQSESNEVSRNAAFRQEAAFAVKREAHLGALAPGMQADVTCLGADLREVAPLELPEVPITATIVGGQVAYQNT